MTRPANDTKSRFTSDPLPVRGRSHRSAPSLRCERPSRPPSRCPEASTSLRGQLRRAGRFSSGERATRQPAESAGTTRSPGSTEGRH